MPAKDEPARCRYEKLVDRLEGLKDVRRAAREAGRRLGWQPMTHVVDARLFV
ncbi:hypothetical protein QQY66_20265 [Streptomyces sp. DG2A-72]|uniref:hypothetical protein n=1 Tax=Streptomyces sp. DG2A-72 TaxID=3051386 RepID=UPI00265C29D8|nr:hypothetical protein [Streptomyces sp. DG2A-72]MDO0933905.1 hypothetical protein [Streptomyces sp. DG2A-72]